MSDETVELIVKVITTLKECQNNYYQGFSESQSSFYNLKKCQVNKVVEGTKEQVNVNVFFQEYLDDYCSGLHFVSLEIESIINHNSFDSRVKQPQSRLSKLLTYRFEKSEKGSLPLNKCLNDLYGCRLTLKFEDLEESCEVLKNALFDFKRVKIKLRKVGLYEAIHIYYLGENNQCFPWELQIWHVDKAATNRESHAKHKQDYLKWTTEMKKEH